MTTIIMRVTYIITMLTPIIKIITPAIKRLSPNQMEHIILELCKEKPLMLKEFAYLLERTPDGVRNNYLTKLLRKGQLQLKYPNQPNHPKQAYLFNKKDIEK